MRTANRQTRGHASGHATGDCKRPTNGTVPPVNAPATGSEESTANVNDDRTVLDRIYADYWDY